jgi:hypothetical protein
VRNAQDLRDRHCVVFDYWDCANVVAANRWVKAGAGGTKNRLRKVGLSAGQEGLSIGVSDGHPGGPGAHGWQRRKVQLNPMAGTTVHILQIADAINGRYARKATSLRF